MLYWCVFVFKNLAERKKRSQEDIVRLEAEITELHATHEVGFLYMFWTVLPSVCSVSWLDVVQGE